MSEVDVLRAGMLTTFQDRGRPGLAHLGVSPSGAVDREAYELGNRLVGNAPGAVALEATLVGPRLRFRAAALVALAGADTVTLRVAAGEVLDVGPLRAGARLYVCVRGGFLAPAVLGSSSTYLLGGLGPPPLRDGDRLAIGVGPVVEPERLDAPARLRGGELRILPGPRSDWFTPAALALLTGTDWTVTQAANRVGVRLAGPVLPRAREGELLSEGLVTGALQVPPSGQPILLLNDHPTTGGYPVIAVVHSVDCSRAAQLRPGDAVRFRIVEEPGAGAPLSRSG